MLSLRQNNRLFDLLIQENININQGNSHGITVLQSATEWPIHEHYYETLLNHPGISINQTNKHGETALLHSLINRKKHIMTNIFIHAIQALLTAGADPELKNNIGTTPLDAAIELKDDIVIRSIKKAIKKKHLL